MEENQNSFRNILKTDTGLKELIDFLRQRGVKNLSNDNNKNKRILRFAIRSLKYKDYVNVLEKIKNNQEHYDKFVFWLEKAIIDHDPEKSFTFNKRKKTLKDYAQLPTILGKKGKRRKKINLSQVPDLIVEFKEPTDTQNLPSVMKHLSEQNINYKAYKENYFLRRLHIRMRKTGKESYREYRKHMEVTPKELEFLVDCLSVNVTRFFRDKELFIKLESEILPQIITRKTENIKIWSAGCAVGPEPYSIAILLKKLSTKAFNSTKILATDLSLEFLKEAQIGRYTKEYLTEIDISEIQSFFEELDNQVFELSPRIRSVVTFKKHDLRTSPPSHGFDLIMCRNVLIYFSRPQGVDLFNRFHSALKPNGYLVLGKCEILPPPVREKFITIDSQNRIYKRNGEN